MQSKKINQLATELAPDLTDITIIGDPTTGISKKITLSQMASLFTGTVEEYASLSAFPLVGTGDTIYIALDTNIIYRWNTGTSSYNELSPNIVTSLIFNDANGFDGTISLVGSTATLSITTALTLGSVPFIGSSGALSQDNANHFWDNTNKRLGINTNAPTTALDVFGSGIIGRLNGTSTNNAFLGFASAGTNRWSIGNVQANNRFRIYNEATTSELISVLSTGEFGIGIANPTTKLHIDGGSSALIANLDADVSIAKSISFRSDNSARINLEVSGTESGSNAGADLFIRAYTDAGALAYTPLTIKRSTGDISVSTKLNVSGAYVDYQNTSYIRFSNSGGATRWGYIQHDGTNIAFVNEVASGNFAFTGGNVGIGMTPTKKFQVNTGTNAILSVQYDITDRVEVGAFSSASGYKDLAISGSTVTIGTGTSGGSSAPVKVTFLPSGNVGIGAVPSVLNPRLGIKMPNTTLWNGISIYSSADESHLYMGHNGTVGAIGTTYGASGSFTPLIFQTSESERMRILANGQIGIGTTSVDSTISVDIQNLSPTSNNVFLRVKNNAGSEDCGFKIAGTFGTAYEHTIGVNTIIASSDLCFTNNNSSGYRWFIDGSEKMEINPTGQVLMNTNAVLTSGWLCIAVPSNNYNAIILKDTGTTYSSANYYQAFTNSSNSIAGSISHNTSSTIGFNTSSDYRLKEDFRDFNGLDILSNIKFYDFKWKEEDKRMHGVIAHELEPLIPLAVSGIKDAIDKEGNIVAQGVDYSKIVPILGKAIQELTERIKQLES